MLMGRFNADAMDNNAVSESAARQRVARWAEAGWVKRERLLGWTWVVPTTSGLRLAGLEYGAKAWEPNGARLAHVHAVALVRLATETQLAARERPGRWVSEREMRRDDRWLHLHDGAVEDVAEGDVPVAFEVELTQKSRQRYRKIVGAIVQKRSLFGLRQVVWFTPPELRAPVEGALAETFEHSRDRDLRWAVRELPTVPGLRYEVAR